MGLFETAKHKAKLTEHHIVYRRADWDHGHQRKLQDHPAMKPLMKWDTHEALHMEMRRRQLDGLEVLPREWVGELVGQCRAEQTMDSLTRMRCVLGNLAVCTARDSEYSDMYMEMANNAIEFFGVQRELLRGEIFVPRVTYVKQ